MQANLYKKLYSGVPSLEAYVRGKRKKHPIEIALDSCINNLLYKLLSALWFALVAWVDIAEEEIDPCLGEDQSRLRI